MSSVPPLHPTQARQGVIMKTHNIFVFLASLITSLVALPLLSACDDDGGGASYVTLTATEKSDLATSMPLAEKRMEHEISEALMEEEGPYVLNGSTVISSLYDAEGALLGYMRLVNTGVGCHDGACAAIKFVLVFDTDLEYVHVFHPSDQVGGDFFKGLDNNTTDSELFTDTDWETLYSILADPPAVLLALTDRLDMVDATTGATFEEYQGSVVHNAAYTTYSVLTYILHTREIIQTELLSEAN